MGRFISTLISWFVTDSLNYDAFENFPTPCLLNFCGKKFQVSLSPTTIKTPPCIKHPRTEPWKLPPLIKKIIDANWFGLFHSHNYLKNSQNNKLQTCSCIKKETSTQVLSCEYCKTFKNSFFIEYVRWRSFIKRQTSDTSNDSIFTSDKF